MNNLFISICICIMNYYYAINNQKMVNMTNQYVLNLKIV